VIPLWASICGYGAASFSIVSATTQGLRILRVRSAIGISTMTWIVGSIASIAWFAYGLSIRSPQQSVANGSWMFFVGVLTWFMLRPRGERTARRGMIAIVATLAAFLLIGVVNPSGPGWIGMVGSLTMTTPQVIHTLRHGRGPGISLLGWAFLTVSSYLWLAYGIGAHELPVVLNTSIGSVLATGVVVALLLRTQRPEPERISTAA